MCVDGLQYAFNDSVDVGRSWGGRGAAGSRCVIDKNDADNVIPFEQGVRDDSQITNVRCLPRAAADDAGGKAAYFGCAGCDEARQRRLGSARGGHKGIPVHVDKLHLDLQTAVQRIEPFPRARTHDHVETQRFRGSLQALSDNDRNMGHSIGGSALNRECKAAATHHASVESAQTTRAIAATTIRPSHQPDKGSVEAD